MSLLMALFGVVVLSHCCAFGASDEHREVIDDHASGAKMNMPLTPLPQNEGRQFLDYPFSSSAHRYRPQKCPLCDSSVYPYCGEKMFHDACCCTEYQQHDLPYQCRLADCRFLHANSCREHRLIANCCCSDDYRALLRALTNA